MILPQVGDRIMLVSMDDDNPVEPGTTGTVLAVDVLNIGTTQIRVNWDARRSLALIAEEDTWVFLPSVSSLSTRACVMVFDGKDTNGDVWNRCTVHDELVFGDAYVCNGYKAPAYKG